MAPLEQTELIFADTAEDADALMRWLGERREWLGLDIETTGTNVGRDRVRVVSVGDERRAYTVPVEGWGWGGLITEALERYDRPIALHNAVFDGSFFVRDELRFVDRLVDDTMVMTHLDASGYSAALKSVATRRVSKRAADGQSALKDAFKTQGWDWDTVPIDFPAYWAYAALDAALTSRLAAKLAPDVLPKYRKSYDLEMGAISVLRDAQVAGMRVDLDYARQMIEWLGARMRQLEPYLPEDVNPNSRDQLEKYFRPRVEAKTGRSLEEVVVERTKGGKVAFNKYVFPMLAEIGFPEAAPMNEWRKSDDLRSNYFENLLELHEGGVVHPNIRVLGAEKTGRMSISRPALQTLPKSAVGRNAFLAREGHTLIMADFEGMEMRMLADVAGCTRMLQNFREGIDQHSWLASQAYRKEVTKRDPERVVAKAAGFAKIYGAGLEKFALTAGIPVDQAEQFLETYDTLFPEVKRFQEDSAALVHATGDASNSRKWGRVQTWAGRDLMVPRSDAYKSVNYRIQGGCAELTKLKIAELANAGLGDAVRLPIHDEIVFEVPDPDVDDAVSTINEVMTERDLFGVEFPVEIETAKRWGSIYEEETV